MHEETRGKEPYEKPSLRIMDLAAEEVLGVGCKNNALPAPGGVAPPCALVSCGVNGS